MRTVKLFQADAYRTEFEGHVLSCSPVGDAWAVVLNQTCFYPASGGQPSDSGTLGGQPVLDVHAEPDGTIVHVVGGPLSGTVVGQVDWTRRLDHMEQHTGQHLLSAAFVHLLQADTVSWHLGAEASTVDIAVENLSAEQVEEVELTCNRLIRAGLPVHAHLCSPEEAHRFPLRKPPTVSGPVRIIEIEGYDWSPCGGTHLRSIGELGLIKIKTWERYKRAVRVTFLAGQRALHDYMALDRMTRDLARRLSIGAADLPRWADRTQEEVTSLRKRVRTQQEELLAVEAERLLAGARRIGPARVVRQTFGGRPADELRLLAAKVAGTPGCVAVFGTRGALPQLIFHRAADLRLDVGQILSAVLPIIDGKGGGSPVQAQGGGTRPERLEEALDAAVSRIAAALRA
ncbi:serine-tRNA(Ala) deacylase AlaX [Symbiobacterium thermophilum]|uniref:serine-tRNA(Ala) deacylase AlaX n=1 Tax=Symbiobacterium thermophilum TaxID=2734 RepID=UPI000042A8A2|nr:serine-tRNA(Ala) deacylase AlaX [Symbiobacterium thermophilum]BAD41751.1 alanyl-tRNA synthetase, truncated [Symbiobacterium thermophilum IAM 14863]